MNLGLILEFHSIYPVLLQKNKTMKRVCCIIFLLLPFWANAQNYGDSASFQTIRVYDIEKKAFRKVKPFYKSVRKIKSIGNQYILNTKLNGLYLTDKNFQTYISDTSSIFNELFNKDNNSATLEKYDFEFRPLLDKNFVRTKSEVIIHKSSKNEKELIIRNLKSKNIIHTIILPIEANDIELSPDEKSFFIIADTNKVFQYQIGSGKLASTTTIKKTIPKKIKISPDGQYFTITTISYGLLSYKLADNRQICEIKPPLPESEISDFQYIEGGKSIIISWEFPNRGNLYLVSIGINKYMNPDLPPLKYCVYDAVEFEKVYLSNLHGINENIKSYKLLDSSASFEDIKHILNKISITAKSEDVFLFFFSGHSDQNGFLTYDSKFKPIQKEFREVSTPLTISNLDFSKMITSDTLKKWTSKIKALKQLYIADACYSYPIFEKTFITSYETFRGFAPIKPNYFWAGVDDFSYEMGNIKHGSLTEIILDCLTSPSIFCPSNNKLSSLEFSTKIQLKAIEKQRFTRYRIKVFNENDFAINNRFVQDVTKDYNSPLLKSIITDTITKAKEVSLLVKAVDEKGIKDVKVFGGNELNSVDKDTYSTRVGLKLGENTFNIVATDVNDNVSDTLKIKIIRKDTLYEPKYKAIFFGIDKYEDKGIKSLNNPIRDAVSIADELNSRFGFDTTIIRNPTLDKIDEVLHQTSIKTYEEQDGLFIFFAGHGYFDPATKRGGLVATNSKSKIFTSIYSYANLEDLLSKHPCKHIFLVIDVCYSGTFFETIANESRLTPVEDLKRGIEVEKNGEGIKSYIKEKLKYKSRYILTSSGKEPVQDGYNHSPFANGLLSILRNPGKKILTIEDIQSKVQEIESTPRLAPFKGNEAGGSFLFVLK